LGGVIRLGGKVIAEQSGLGSEAIPGELHAVTGITGESNHDLLELLSPLSFGAAAGRRHNKPPLAPSRKVDVTASTDYCTFLVIPLYILHTRPSTLPQKSQLRAHDTPKKQRKCAFRHFLAHVILRDPLSPASTHTGAFYGITTWTGVGRTG